MITDAQLERELDARGIDYSVQIAGTGTRYFHCEKAGLEFTIRLSDHAEAYAPAIGVRQICISPFEAWNLKSIKYLLDNPESVPESEGPRPLDKWQKEALAEQAEAERKFKTSWKALRESLPTSIFEEFKLRGGNRTAARNLAQKYGYGAGKLGAGKLYSALTNGKKF